MLVLRLSDSATLTPFFLYFEPLRTRLDEPSAADSHTAALKKNEIDHK